MRFSPCFLVILLNGALCPEWAVEAAQPKGGERTSAATAREILRGAEGRIEKQRKADGVLMVTDAAGRPVRDAKVSIEQTRHQFLFGCNIFRWGKNEDQALDEAYRTRFAALFNYATLPFYWPSYEPRQGDQTAAEQIARVAEWCKAENIATKGHPLAWNYSEPRWLPQDPAEIYRLQLERIADCVNRFEGAIDRWDVVNEVTHYDRAEFIDRAPKYTAMWKQYGHIEFTRTCFEAARKANPQATLLINDYRVDPAYEKVIEQLVDQKGKPLYDVIGIQSHMHGGAWPVEKTWEVCERFSRFGVPLHFTETTVLSGERKGQMPPGQPWPTTPEGEKHQAEAAVQFYTLLFSHPAVEAITWWDFSDLKAWKGAPAGFVREDMSPKPVYDELMKRIKGEWWTSTEAKTGADGAVRFRGFLGDYRVTVTLPGGEKPQPQQFRLEKGEVNRWTLTL
ncbi:MAG: endo-1,4-beta-xylanase [Planctomycetota bacterium]